MVRWCLIHSPEHLCVRGKKTISEVIYRGAEGRRQTVHGWSKPLHKSSQPVSNKAVTDRLKSSSTARRRGVNRRITQRPTVRVELFFRRLRVLGSLLRIWRCLSSSCCFQWQCSPRCTPWSWGRLCPARWTERSGARTTGRQAHIIFGGISFDSLKVYYLFSYHKSGKPHQ